MKKSLLILFVLLQATVFAQNEAFVVNSLAETLSKIDLETNTVTNHITLLGLVPNQVVKYDNYLYVVNSISASIMKINVSNFQDVTTINMPLGSNPYNIAISANGNFGYVTGWASGIVYRINISTNSIDAQVNIGEYPEGIMVSNGYLYVTRTNFDPATYAYGQGSIAKINASTFELEGFINVGNNPQAISESLDGKLHIVCTGNYSNITGSVYIYDPATDAVSDSVLVGGQPAGLAISNTGIGFLAAGGWADNGYVYSYDLFTGQVYRGESNPILTGLGVTAVGADLNGFIFTCNFGDDSVSKLDLNGNILSTYTVGDGPVSIAVNNHVIIGVDDSDNPEMPVTYYSITNYPNPFNAGTNIKIEMNSSNCTPERVRIFDLNGRLVKILNLETNSGSGYVYWDGRGNDEIVTSGIYFAVPEFKREDLDSNGIGKSAKMVLIK